MTLAQWLPFALASAVLLAIPGPTVLLVVSYALGHGRKYAFATTAGVALGDLTAMTASMLGLGVLLAASAELFMMLKWAGAAYLVYLGARMLLTREVAIDARTGLARSSPPWLVLQGVLSNVTNPKIVLFFFAFLPQFVDPASPHPTRDLIALGVLYAMLGLPVKCGVAVIAARLSDRMLRRPRALVWMNRACGALLVALGVRLARG